MQSWGVDAAEAERRMVAEENLTRIGESADVAGLVSFIVSPRGSYLQGALIDIDGGKTKTM
jgi:3-oxoacyl-[acyl-carrier protein] reductase